MSLPSTADIMLTETQIKEAIREFLSKKWKVVAVQLSSSPNYDTFDNLSGYNLTAKAIVEV